MEPLPMCVWLSIAVPALLSIVAFIARSEKASWATALAASFLSVITTGLIVFEGYTGHASLGGFIALGGHSIAYSFASDYFSRTMALVTSLITFIVILFSRDYMAGEPGYGRYYSALLVFEAAMLGVAYSANLVILLVFWEILGFTSFMLIGFWYKRPRARRAARLAILVTGLADLGLIAAVVYGAATGLNLALPLSSGPGIVLLLVAIAAIAKSAQFPLHIWLLEAMEAPTTVSALLHSATMVAAGAYLLERIHGALLRHEALLLGLSWLGCFTALYAAVLALQELDAKRVLAYSTVSNLGVMLALLYAPSPIPSFIHLVVHAFFKASLFLAIAAAIHSIGSTSLLEMGGLRTRIRLSYIVALAASLAQVGLPLYGSWISHSMAGEVQSTWLRVILEVEGLLAGLYIGRWLALAYHGEPRSAGARSAAEHAFMKAGYVALLLLMAASGPLVLWVFNRPLGAVVASLEAASSSLLGLAGFAASVMLYASRGTAVIEEAAAPLGIVDRALYTLYYGLIPRACLACGRVLHRLEAGLSVLHEASSSWLVAGLGKADEPPRRRGAQYMLLLGFFTASVIVVIVFLLEML